MAKKIKIDGVIGWDVKLDYVERKLAEANGEDIHLYISSPGGSVFEGLSIFNAIREYVGNVKIRIIGLAASMATYISSLPSAEVEVYDNSIFMIHNPWNLAIGDYRDMQKNADFLKSLAEMLSREYANKTGKKKEECVSLMDEESWFFGSEIKDAGFADVVLDSGEDTEKKDESISQARIEFNAMMAKMQKDENSKNDLHKAAAFLNKLEPKQEPNIEPKSENKNIKQEGKEGVNMTPEEIKAKYPMSFAAIAEAARQEGREQGKVEEQKRVKAHLMFIDVAKDEVLKNISEGKSVQDQEVHASYTLANMKNQEVANISGDNPVDVSVDGDTQEPGTQDNKEATEDEVASFLQGK